MAEVRIEPIDNADEFLEAFDVPCEGFGEQTRDGVWIQMNPGWDTPKGKQVGAQGFVDRVRSGTHDNEGRPNIVFLKASLPEGPNGKHKIVGLATWMQVSVVDGYGQAPTQMLDPASLYPDDPKEQRYVRQLYESLFKRRHEVAKEKASASPPAIFVLDLCVVKPAYQGQGIATKLVRWGMDEAKRRGGLECTTEASIMGRRVYAKLGFQSEGEIEFVVDDEFRSRDRPSNLFMRTGQEGN